MFDVGFWEFGLIAVIGLIVIGPEQLPEVARTLGKWFAKAKGFVSSVKHEIQEELALDELKNSVGSDVVDFKASVIEELNSISASTQSDLNSLERAVVDPKGKSPPDNGITDIAKSE